MAESSGSTHNALDDELELLSRLLGTSPGTEAGDVIPRRGVDGLAVPSFAQELLWLLHRATPGLVAYNLPSARRLRGRLDVAALQQALTTVVERHDALRTRFVERDGELSLAIDPAASIALRIVDLGAFAATTREAEAQRILTECARAPFDLARDHMFRVTLIRIDDEDQILVLETHHIVADGWSLGVINRDLAAAYAAFRNGDAPVLPPPGPAFSDFAAWQRGRLTGQRLDALLDFWRAQLGDAETPLDLPTDRPRPATPTFDGSRVGVLIPAERLDAIKRLGQRHGATLYMVLLSAYAAVLHRYTGRRDVLIGSGTAGRMHPETESIVGYLSNTVVQRASFGNDPTFAELLVRVRESASAAFDHQDVPLEKLALELRKDQEQLSHTPLFDVVLTMQDTPGEPLTLAGVAAEPVRIEGRSTKFDITLLPSERADGLWLGVQYRTDLFEGATMERFLGHLTSVLDGAVANPDCRASALPLLTAAEQAQLASWNATQCDEGPAATIFELFSTQAARVPHATAVVCGEVTITYAELARRAGAVASALARAGVHPGARVALLMDRSVDAITGLLGTLAAGAAYVPIPPDVPAARRDQQLRECGAHVALAASDVNGLPGDVIVVDVRTVSSDSRPAAPVSPESLAYVLYTSGSTGTPKGVAVTHRNLVHYVRAVSRVLGDVAPTTAGDGLAALGALSIGTVSTLAADLGNTSVFTALLSGATLHIIPSDVASDPARFAESMRYRPLDVLKITPGHFAALAYQSGGVASGCIPRGWLIFGGEALGVDLARAVASTSGCRVLNHYGPTETTVGACTFEVTRAWLEIARELGSRTVPIGSPLTNTRALVLDRNRGELPVGIPGDLWISGDGVARGYLEREDLTRDRFAVVAGARAYCTGDRARRLPSGALEYLGRLDDQVKIRGFRVELGEVEHAIRANGSVAEAVVVVRTDEHGEAALVAYVVARTAGYGVSHGPRLSVEALAAELHALLPAYMVPSVIMLLDELPRSQNGKVDRNRLPAPEQAATAAHAFVAPSTDTERELAAIWSDVLKREQVGAHDNFLTLGGHSLMAIRVLGRISRSFGVRISLRALFEGPTVSELAAVVDRERAAASAAGGPISARARDAHRVATGPGQGLTPSTESV